MLTQSRHEQAGLRLVTFTLAVIVLCFGNHEQGNAADNFACAERPTKATGRQARSGRRCAK